MSASVGMFPGITLSSDPTAPNTVGMELINSSGAFTPKGPNFELILVGGGGFGSRAVGGSANGGSSAASLIRRIIGFQVGLSGTLIIGGAASVFTNPGGTSILLLPGYATMTAPGCAINGVAGSIATGGDFNLAGQNGLGIDQNGGGGTGGSTLLGIGGQTTGGTAFQGTGYGVGGSGAGNSEATGTGGALLVRYF